MMKLMLSAGLVEAHSCDPRSHGAADQRSDALGDLVAGQDQAPGGDDRRGLDEDRDNGGELGAIRPLLGEAVSQLVGACLLAAHHSRKAGGFEHGQDGPGQNLLADTDQLDLDPFLLRSALPFEGDALPQQWEKTERGGDPVKSRRKGFELPALGRL